MMKCDFGWADLGTWHSIYEAMAVLYLSAYLLVDKLIVEAYLSRILTVVGIIDTV